ncbi:MAG TPA: dienelactone hydrolase family protein [Acidimicrobiia bacterium]|nr:dienelactone hydrolase family protein [Acidimicrobiia bacterium]
MITFPSNGSEGQGYLAIPESGSGPGIIVIQEWWGLNDQIKAVADAYAQSGFVALAPDLYRGTTTTEPDEAGKLMMSMNLERAGKDMGGAIDALLQHRAVTSKGVGVTGYCVGGGLALLLATQRPDAVVAVAPYYGLIPWPVQPDYAKLAGPVQGHYAERDDYAGPEKVHALETELRDLGKPAEFFIYPGTEHAFTNHHRPEVYDDAASSDAFVRTVEFFRTHVR